MTNANKIESAKEILRGSKRIFVLTGAGVSAESGVPTFRGGGGATLWRGMPFEQLSSAQMVERDLPLVWEWFDYRRNLVGECLPNAAHETLAAVQQSERFDDFVVVTQNIDRLHQAAGAANVIELHGSVWRARCLSCKAKKSLREIPADERPPVCEECFDSMRPDVILFGEAMPMQAVTQAQAAAQNCDVCIVVGTSALVHPAAELPLIAKQSGATVIEINPEETPLTARADVSLRGRAAEILPQLFAVESVGQNSAVKEAVLEIACEGGGAELFRFKADDGKWRFFTSGSSISLDENDDEEWISWENEPVESIAEAIESFKLGYQIFIFHPLFISAEHRAEVKKYLEDLYESLTEDEKERLKSFEHSAATPDKWLAAAEKETERRAKRSGFD